MADLALVACAKTKRALPSTAATLYVSSLFRKSLLAALDQCKRVRVLSAKHGLLDLGQVVAPYELTLKTMPSADRRKWGEEVGAHLTKIVAARDRVIIFGGDDYIQPLESVLERHGCPIERPLGTRSLGARLQHLRTLNDEASLEAMLPRFDRLIRRLARAQAGGRLLSQTNGRQVWPDRGIYFVSENVGPASRDRITRVGTHAVSAGSRTSLWDRISTHRGAGHGGGSHRSSIFRSHVGRALIRRGDAVAPATWGVGQSAPADIRASEANLEQVVSETIGEMRLLWLDVPDAAGPRSDRAYLERNTIGLISRANLLGLRTAPNPNWLGHSSADWRIAASGLWNLDHLFHRPDPQFLDMLEAYVDIATRGDTLGKSTPTPTRLAKRKALKLDKQLSLFGTVVATYGG